MPHDRPGATGDLADQVVPHMRQSPRSTPIGGEVSRGG